MIRDLLLDRPDPAHTADILVVGAGAAGITLAVELARLGRQVTLLEGGGPVQEDSSQQLYQSELAARPHRGVHVGRFRVHGGTTTEWGGQILELDELDFTKRPWISGSGWPITKADLAPYYARALALEGVGGSILDDGAVWQRLGLSPPTFGDPDDPQLLSYLSRWCPEPNFARLHKQELEGSSRIQVWLHSNAVELPLQDDRARGVCARTLTGEGVLFQARTVVLALGAIETSRFLLQPRSDEAPLPWNQSGLVGQHFQDHIDSDAATIRPRDARALHRDSDNIFLDGYKYNPKLKLSPASQEESQTLNAGATIYSSSELDATLADTKAMARTLLRGRLGEVTGAQLRSAITHAPLLARQAVRYAVHHRAWHPRSAEIRLRVHAEQEPTSRSSITLSPERDRLGVFRTRLNWQISPLELCTIRHVVRMAQQALAPIAEVVPHPDLFAPDDRFLDRCDDSYHHMGGARMHPSAALGVVDTDLRLHGTRNAYVCSSAVFPTSGFSNPTHTLLALTVRLAEHLAKQGDGA